MTENRRILLNVVVTYARSIFALVCGLLTGRWVLMALGPVDYGLYGVVGGLTVFIAFFNSLLAGALVRFYTFSVGRAKIETSTGLAECQAWFNTALSVHTIVPFALLIVGYPCGVWAICSFLTIPPDRVDACVWVFRFACLSCFIGMVNVPFSAMYKAKQYLAELTIYSFATTALNVCALYWMVSRPGDWLVRYALWMCLMVIVPEMIICVRAVIIFPECRIKPNMMFRLDRFWTLASFAGWQLIGALSSLLRGQGMSLVINKFFGPRVNAAMTIANQVDGQTSALASAMLGAFSPAITTAYGAKDYKRMETLVFAACKFSALFSLVFILPLAFNLEFVLRLWLKTPPEYVAGLTLVIFAVHVIENLTYGHMIAVNATGRIARYQITMGSISLLTVPIAVCWAFCGGGPYTIGYSILITQISYTIVRVVLTNRIVGLSIRYWVMKILLPIAVLPMACVVIELLISSIVSAGVCHFILSSAAIEVTVLLLSWRIVLAESERDFLLVRVQGCLRRFIR